ncbi:unnamed protein product [Coffea canephora]|uniref:DH200=94 genomic scaffold, scaffold_174 n=1 Tax=Coffea canephora TaxID=49390 RepID=A0A068VDH4_COFCA|nr:unnamed protein product [Coffea canephora]
MGISRENLMSILYTITDLMSGILYADPQSISVSYWKETHVTFGDPSFCICNGNSWLQIILESLRTLISDEDGFNLTAEQECWAVGIMLSVTLGVIIFSSFVVSQGIRTW